MSINPDETRTGSEPAADVAFPPELTGEWPVFGLEEDVRPALARAVEAGRVAALATLYAADGGAPRGVGAQLLVSAEEAAGYLSGGCIEADVARHALDVIGEGEPRWLVYGEGGPVDIRLPCGGRVEILVERLQPDDPGVQALIASAEERRPALWFSDGVHRACAVAGAAPAVSHAALSEATRSARKAGIAQTSRTVFRKYAPRFRAVIIGGDPTALAMAMLAAQSGIETFLLRPKGPSVPPPVPGVHYLRGDVSAALAGIDIDPWTAVAVATHDEIDDHEALVATLPSRAAYVGLLGSRRRLKVRLDGLRYAGVAEATIARLRAPIGFDLGSSAPFQIALGAVAEMVQALNAVGIGEVAAFEAAAPAQSLA